MPRPVKRKFGGTPRCVNVECGGIAMLHHPKVPICKGCAKRVVTQVAYFMADDKNHYHRLAVEGMRKLIRDASWKAFFVEFKFGEHVESVKSILEWANTQADGFTFDSL